MRIDIKKLDERIQKLQEIRKIAADPELASILLEFVGTDDDVATEQPIVKALDNSVATPSTHSTIDVLKDVVSGSASEARGGLWSRKAAGQ